MKIDFNYENLKNDNGKNKSHTTQSNVTLNATESILARHSKSSVYNLIMRLLGWLWPVDPRRIAVSERNVRPALMSGAEIALTIRRKLL